MVRACACTCTCTVDAWHGMLVSICIPHASSGLQGADADITYISPISPLYLTYIFPTSSLYLQSADAAKVCGYGYLLGEIDILVIGMFAPRGRRNE